MKEIFKHIEKELEYANLKHKNQRIGIFQSIHIAQEKLNKINYYKICGYPRCLCTNEDFCNEKLHAICISFASIAILIKGILFEKESEPKDLEIRRKHLNELIKNLTEDKTDIRSYC